MSALVIPLLSGEDGNAGFRLLLFGPNAIYKGKWMRKILGLTILLSLAGCTTDDSSVCTQAGDTYSCDDKVPAPAALVGSFKFLHLELNYVNGDHVVYDSTTTTGTLQINASGSFSQTIDYNGKITNINGAMKSITTVSPTRWDITSNGETDVFEINGDTLIQSVDVPKGTDPKGIGFHEDDFFIKTK